MNEKQETRSKQLQLTASPSDVKRIKAFAKKLGISVSTYLLRAAIQMIESHEAHNVNR